MAAQLQVRVQVAGWLRGKWLAHDVSTSGEDAGGGMGEGGWVRDRWLARDVSTVGEGETVGARCASYCSSSHAA